MKRDYTEEQRYIKAKKRVDNIKGFYGHLSVYIVVNIFISCVVIYGITKDEGYTFSEALTHPGVYMTWFGWGIGVIFHWLGVFGFQSFFSKNWEERKIRELMEKDEEKGQNFLNK